MSATAGPGGLFRQATTTSGEILGLVNEGVIQFKGVPYGAPTGGKRRYRVPERRAPWRGRANASATGRSAHKFRPASPTNTGD